MNALNKIIELSFYALFFFVPLIFFGNTSELFEFNKMWLAFGLTIIIATTWIIKMTLHKQISIQKTPLDIPILLFLFSQIISSIFSLDPHVSWWGYYSRFNGGLLSTITYIVLYYAFVSNLQTKHVLRILSVSLASGIIVALWAFPGHFGYDPTCFLFRGTLDTACWTDAFKPTIRTFSTLGQPAWLAAYLALLLPITMISAFQKAQGKNHKLHLTNRKFILFLLLSAFFYVNLIFTDTRAGILGFAVADIVFFALLFITFSPKKAVLNYFIVIHLLFLVSSFFFGTPIGNLNKYTFWHLNDNNQPAAQSQTTPSSTAPSTQPAAKPAVPVDNGITDSGDIRKLVWKGAFEAWKANPIFGTGVETYAFAYYKYKPAAHNLTSEWDYLYNKAHNEYLNYLATTGIVGLGTYLVFLGGFIVLFTKYVLKKKESEFTLVNIGLFVGWVSILITNFFGFSVVIMNIYLFLIPTFFFLLADLLDTEKTFTIGSGSTHTSRQINPYQWTAIVIAIITALFMLFSLLWYWYADVAYALGNNYDKIGQYQEAYPKLLEAVNTEPNEPTYKDELAINTAVLATALYAQKDTENGNKFAKNAIDLSDNIVTTHPNDVVFWKNRVRIFYTLAQGSPANQQQYIIEAVKAIDKATELAPNDAKISYNQGVLYGQSGNPQKGAEILENTIKLKPNYRDAYVALGLFYHQLAVDKDNKIVDQSMQQKAIDTYQYILTNMSPDDKQIKDSLKEWQTSK